MYDNLLYYMELLIIITTIVILIIFLFIKVCMLSDVCAQLA